MTEKISADVEKVANGVRHLKESLECGTCLDTLKSPAYTLCGHVFCTACIQQVLRNKNPVCPMCKSRISRRKILYDETIDTCISLLENIVHAVRQDCGVDVFSLARRPSHTRESHSAELSYSKLKKIHTSEKNNRTREVSPQPSTSGIKWKRKATEEWKGTIEQTSNEQQTALSSTRCNLDEAEPGNAVRTAFRSLLDKLPDQSVDFNANMQLCEADFTFNNLPDVENERTDAQSATTRNPESLKKMGGRGQLKKRHSLGSASSKENDESNENKNRQLRSSAVVANNSATGDRKLAPLNQTVDTKLRKTSQALQSITSLSRSRDISSDGDTDIKGRQEESDYLNDSQTSNISSAKKNWSNVVKFGKEMRTRRNKLKRLDVSVENTGKSKVPDEPTKEMVDASQSGDTEQQPLNNKAESSVTATISLPRTVVMMSSNEIPVSPTNPARETTDGERCKDAGQQIMRERVGNSRRTERKLARLEKTVFSTENTPKTPLDTQRNNVFPSGSSRSALLECAAATEANFTRLETQPRSEERNLKSSQGRRPRNNLGEQLCAVPTSFQKKSDGVIPRRNSSVSFVKLGSFTMDSRRRRVVKFFYLMPCKRQALAKPPHSLLIADLKSFNPVETRTSQMKLAKCRPEKTAEGTSSKITSGNKVNSMDCEEEGSFSEQAISAIIEEAPTEVEEQRAEMELDNPMKKKIVSNANESRTRTGTIKDRDPESSDPNSGKSQLPESILFISLPDNEAEDQAPRQEYPLQKNGSNKVAAREPEAPVVQKNAISAEVKLQSPKDDSQLRFLPKSPLTPRLPTSKPAQLPTQQEQQRQTDPISESNTKKSGLLDIKGEHSKALIRKSQETPLKKRDRSCTPESSSKLKEGALENNERDSRDNGTPDSDKSISMRSTQILNLDMFERQKDKSPGQSKQDSPKDKTTSKRKRMASLDMDDNSDVSAILNSWCRDVQQSQPKKGKYDPGAGPSGLKKQGAEGVKNDIAPQLFKQMCPVPIKNPVKRSLFRNTGSTVGYNLFKNREGQSTVNIAERRRMVPPRCESSRVDAEDAGLNSVINQVRQMQQAKNNRVSSDKMKTLNNQGKNSNCSVASLMQDNFDDALANIDTQSILQEMQKQECTSKLIANKELHASIKTDSITSTAMSMFSEECNQNSNFEKNAKVYSPVSNTEPCNASSPRKTIDNASVCTVFGSQNAPETLHAGDTDPKNTSHEQDSLMDVTQDEILLKRFEQDLFASEKSKSALDQQRMLDASTPRRKKTTRQAEALPEEDDQRLDEEDIVESTPIKIAKSSTQLISSTPNPQENILTTPPRSSTPQTAQQPGECSPLDSPPRVGTLYEYTPLEEIVKEEVSDNESVVTTMSTVPMELAMLNDILSVKEEFWPTITPRICITTSDLSEPKIQAVQILAKQLGGEYTKSFSTDVTHVIVATYGRENCAKQTLKYIQGIAHRKWVLGFKWVKDCLQEKRELRGEPYELLDCETEAPGPMRSRTRRTDLFREFVFFCTGPYLLIPEEVYKDILMALGAGVVGSLAELATIKDKYKIITHQSGDYDQAQVIDCYKQAGAVSVTCEWLIDSISQYEVRPIGFFLQGLFPRDLLALGYPKHLV